VTGIDALREIFAFPGHPADVQAIDHGWLSASTSAVLSSKLNNSTAVVVELGSWLGKSTRFIADHAPAAVIIAIDHWMGSAEHQSQEDTKYLLPILYDTFIKSCWDYRGRIVPLRMDTISGMETVASHGVSTDLVYIDASHDYDSVRLDLEVALRLFPKAQIIGDDWLWPGVRRAVTDVSVASGFTVGSNGNCWWKA